MINVRCLAPISGKIIPIEKVKDDVFSNKMLGDGIAIIPCSNQVCSPVDGTLTMIFRTGHAFVVKNKDGIEFLVHIGIDTVQYKGNGFHIVAKEGAEVKAGEKIINLEQRLFDLADMTTMVIVFNNERIEEIVCQKVGQCYAGSDSVMNIDYRK